MEKKCEGSVFKKSCKFTSMVLQKLSVELMYIAPDFSFQLEILDQNPSVLWMYIIWA